MNIKKVFTNVLMGAVAATTLLSGALYASAELYMVTADVFTFSDSKYLTCGNHYVYPGYSIVTSTTPGYTSAYKEATYAQYGTSGGSTYYISGSSNSGTGTVNSGSVVVTGAVWRRVHGTNIHYTSDSGSSVRESVSYLVDKA